ncbi:MAG TPA: hypothetical protein VGT04_09845 [Acidobacteriaceae bacterium]|nr:hypothetical protein [Acidobacteriaceae bacterium]
MEYGVARPVRVGSVERPADADVASRMRELEEENARLRLLVSELLVENQRLRESARKAVAPAA